MKDAKRAAMIDEIVASAPSALGLATNARRNLESLSDAELTTYLKKLRNVRGYAAKTKIVRQDISVKREQLAARRAARYARIAGLSAQADGNLDTSSQAPSLQATAPIADDLSGAVRQWNTFDIERDAKHTELLRQTMLCWLQDFGNKALAYPTFYVEMQNLLEGDLKPQFDRYLDWASDRMGRDVMRIARNHLVHKLPDRKSVYSAERAIINAMTIDAVETGFLASRSGLMRETVAIDGLAKMRSFAINYQPDIILCASAGGKIVGDFIAVEAKLTDPRARLIALGDRGAKVAGGWGALRNCRRVLLVDDVAESSDRLSSAHRGIAEHISEDSKIQIVALTSSLTARDQLIQDGHANLFVAQVTDQTIDVPWDRGGEYKGKAKDHVFGAGGDAKMVVTKAQIRRVSESLLEALRETKQTPAAV